jgi:hypothetical protein
VAGTLGIGSTYTHLVSAEVVDQADVVVTGGGSAGVVAAIAAARNGADVLLVERHGFLGGMMTGGNAGLTKYIVHESDQQAYSAVLEDLERDPASVQVIGGIPLEITRRLMEAGSAIGTGGQAGSYVFTAQDDFKYLLLDMMEEVGVRLRLHSMVVDAIVENGALVGIILESKSGRQVILGRVFVDATGDGDLAARAGVPYFVGVGPEDLVAKEGGTLGKMGALGIMFRMGNVDLGRCFDYLRAHMDHFRVQRCALLNFEQAHQAYLRGDMMTINVAGFGPSLQIYNTPLPGVVTLCCPCYEGNGLSVEDLTQGELALAQDVRQRVSALRAALPGFEHAYLLDVPEIGVRETRHIRGAYLLTIEDILADRAFADAIGRGCHPIDTSPVPELLRKRPLSNRWSFSIPYRSLIALKIGQLLLAGRCISQTHEASGCTRTTVQCMITGQAAGTAAALCASSGESPRELDIGALQRRLVEDGVIL